jgi:hypothetical protein
MNTSMVVLRLVHILGGVFWAGTLMFNATLLAPSVRDAGPGGAGVMPALMRRRFLDIMPVIAGLTILSGIDLLRRASGGFAAAWFTAPYGMTLTAGALAALIAFGIGLGVLRPTALKMGRLAKNGVAETQQVEMKRLQRRSMLASRWTAGWLTVAVAAMAVARYMG